MNTEAEVIAALDSAKIGVMEKVRLTKEVKQIFTDLPTMKAMEKVRATKRIGEILALLGSAAKGTDYESKIAALEGLPIAELTEKLFTLSEEMEKAGVIDDYISKLQDVDHARDGEFKKFAIDLASKAGDEAFYKEVSGLLA